MNREEARVAAQALQKDLIEQFEKAAKANGLSANKALEAIGFGKVNYYNAKNGKVLMRSDTLIHMADYCGADIDIFPRLKR